MQAPVAEMNRTASSSSILGMVEKIGLQDVIVALCFCLLWVVFTFYEPALLHRIDSLSLFLFDDLYFEEMISVPAGPLSYLGCFLIQFFHYPALGAAIYVSLLYLVYILTRRVFDIPKNYAFLALMPVVALLASNTQLGYWIYYLKLPGYYYIAVLSVIFSLLAMSAYRKLGGVWRIPFLVSWVIVGYPVMGVYALASALIMSLMGFPRSLKCRKELVFAAVSLPIALLLVYFVPRYYYYNFYDTVDLELVYWSGVPAQEWWFDSVKEAEYETESFWHSMSVYKVPLYMLLVSFALLVSSLYLRGVRVLRKRYTALLPYAVLVACMLFAVRYWYNDKNFRIENKQNIAMWEGDWKAVLMYAKETDAPTRMIVVNKNIAMTRLGLQSDGYFSAGDNSVEPDAPMALKMQYIGGYDTYFYYGRMNYCYRWCMENSVEYGWRPEYLKNAARSMIAAGEYRLAKRYLRILKHTMFHDSWAENMEKLIENEDKIQEKLKSDRQFAVPMQFGAFSDMLGTDESIEEYLMANVNAPSREAELDMMMFDALVGKDAETFRQCVHEADAIADVYWNASLMMPLVKKDMKGFWTQLDAYFRRYDLNDPSVSVQLPKACQEALFLFATLDKGRSVAISPNLMNRLVGDTSMFDRFYKEVKKNEKDLRDAHPDITEKRLNAICAERLRKSFGNTYYYYYFFVKSIRTY